LIGESDVVEDLDTTMNELVPTKEKMKKEKSVSNMGKEHSRTFMLVNMFLL